MSLLDTASLIVTPNGYKDGKLYSVIPSDGSGDLSVTRATTATRVNSAGVVELVPYNLLQYSQDFSNAYWFAEPGNSITSNTTAAPDGTTTADTFTATSGNGMNVHNAGSFDLSDGTFTYSVHLKNNGTNLIEAYLFKIGVGFAARGEINFSAETFTASIGTGTITNVGNGWYRVTLTNTYTSGSFTTGTYTTSTTGTRSVFAWGAQVVEGSTAKDYQKTETRLNIPRLDYSNGTCPSLLVEPQRTNLVTYSSSLDNAAWTKSNVTINANAVISPSGIQDADKLIETTATGAHRIFPTSTSGLNGTFSFFAKSGERTKVAILSTIIDLGFDLSNGTLIDLGSGTSSGKIEDYGNGWYRCSLYQSTGIVSLSIGLLNNSNAISYTGDGTSGTYIWGAQLENAFYQTSYIPTTSAAVTRNADVISKTGISSIIGQTEGTFFTEFYYNGIIDNSNARKIISLNDGSSTNLIDAYISLTDNTITTRVRANDSSLGQINSAVLTQGFYKIAYAYKNSDFVLYVNGVQAGSVSSGTISFTSAVSIAQIGDGEASNDQLGSLIKAAALWKTRLTNTQLAQLTTI